MDIINKKKIKKQWKSFLKKEDFSGFLSFYQALHFTAQSLMLQMVDFLFIEEVYIAFLELIELDSNLTMLLETKSQRTYEMCKHRINYLLQNKIENWYI